MRMKSLRQTISRKAVVFIQLHMLMFVFSLSSLFLKLASDSVLLSWEFILYFGLGFAMLGIYALFFQQILKKMKLTSAYANKAIVIVWALIWDLLFIRESAFTLGKPIGFVIILAGIYLMADNPKSESNSSENNVEPI